MSEGEDLTQRRLGRDDLLKLAAVTGGAAFLGGPHRDRRRRQDAPGGGERAAAGARLGRVRQRRRSVDVRAVREEPPEQQAAVHVHDERVGRARRRSTPGSSRTSSAPTSAGSSTSRQSGLVQPWDPTLISNFKHLNPFMVKAGQYNGKQYGIPDDWGFDAILYRSDKVHAEGEVVGPALRRALQGQDRLVRRPRDARRSPASTSGSRIRGTRPTPSSSSRRSCSSRRSTSSA